MLPTIHDLKESLKDDGISDDTINRFLPESKLKKLSMNLPGVKLNPYMTLSETPNSVGLQYIVQSALMHSNKVS